MDDSALFRSLSILEKSSSSLDTWFNICTVIVAVGIAVELIVLYLEYSHERRDFDRGIIRPPDKPSRAKLIFEAIGIVLVFGGVAGELGVHIKAGEVESAIRSVNRKLVERADGRAVEALNRANREGAARLELQKELLWQGPRDVLIRSAQLDFVVPLATYRGQRFRLSDCELDVPVGPAANSGDITGTALALATELDIARWQGVPSQAGIPAYIPRMILGCSANGVGVFVSPRATPRTRDAATALDTILVKVLSEHITPRVLSTDLIPRARELPPAANDVVEILIGRHLQHRFDLQ